MSLCQFRACEHDRGCGFYWKQHFAEFSDRKKFQFEYTTVYLINKDLCIYNQLLIAGSPALPLIWCPPSSSNDSRYRSSQNCLFVVFKACHKKSWSQRTDRARMATISPWAVGDGVCVGDVWCCVCVSFPSCAPSALVADRGCKDRTDKEGLSSFALQNSGANCSFSHIIMPIWLNGYYRWSKLSLPG